MTRPVLPRSDDGWREEVRRLARIQYAAKLERRRSVEWAAFVALLSRALAAAIDPNSPEDEARILAAHRYLHDAMLIRPRGDPRSP